MGTPRIVVDILGDASSFTNATKQAQTSAGKFSNVMKGIGQGFGIGITQMAGRAADAVGDFVQGSIQAASDLNETISKSSVIFGDGSAAVREWARAADDSLGLSERAALDAASGFAGLFKTVGLGLDESTAMAEQMTKMGSDLASFFNTDMETALAALKSGLNGESEPLRQFNVFLSETAVTSKLVKMGIEKVNGQFTEAQKATARYQLIMEQTTDAQGDFARTSDGLANSTRTLDAKMENLSARLGQGLLPLVEQGVSGVLNFADAVDVATDSTKTWDERLGATGGLIDTLANLNPATWSTRVVMGALSDAQAEAADTAGELAAGLQSTGMVAFRADERITGTKNAMFGAATAADKLKRGLTPLRTGLSATGQAALDMVNDMIAIRREGEYLWGLRNPTPSSPTSGKPKKKKERARGGVVMPGEITWVGEQGPEMVSLPPGSRVHSNQKSRQMMGGGPGITVNVAGSIIGPSGIDELMDMMAVRLRLDGY